LSRSLSHSEIGTVSDCEYRWAFRYGGQLTGGDALRPKVSALRLREGRAWGRAVAAYGAHLDDVIWDAEQAGRHALDESLEEDAKEQRSYGVHDPAAHEEAAARLRALFDLYVETTEPLPVDRLEDELDVPVPARTGTGRGSSRYRFRAYLDALHRDALGVWVVEYKLRGRLTALEDVARATQNRRYAWAAREAYGLDVVGFVVDEFWNEVPREPRVLKNGRPSHAANQIVRPGDYRDVCLSLGEEPDPETLATLEARRWSGRHRIQFRDGELDQVGRELTSAARLIGELDSGARTPVPNPKPQHCNGCPFREICPDPLPDHVDLMFERTPPKRDRDHETEGTHARAVA
jgi:hypothetical protein